MPIVIRSEKISLSSEKKTEELANQLFKKIKPGNIIFLYGEMGVGKTTFIKYLINEFQKRNKLKITEITSPTFNLLNEYQIGKIKLNHYDLFRLKSPNEAENLNIFDNKLNELLVSKYTAADIAKVDTNRFRPHLTLGLYDNSFENQLKEVIKKYSSYEPVDIKLSSFGIFPNNKVFFISKFFQLA